MNQSEWFDKIEKLSNKKGVKKIAVQNFLASIGSNPDKMSAMMNAEMDAGMYGWNSATQGAIYDGISIYFDKVKTGESKASEMGDVLIDDTPYGFMEPDNPNSPMGDWTTLYGTSYTDGRQTIVDVPDDEEKAFTDILEQEGYDWIPEKGYYGFKKFEKEAKASEDSLVKIEDDDDKDTKVTVLDEWENETDPDVGGDVEGLDQDQVESDEVMDKDMYLYLNNYDTFNTPEDVNDRLIALGLVQDGKITTAGVQAINDHNYKDYDKVQVPNEVSNFSRGSFKNYLDYDSESHEVKSGYIKCPKCNQQFSSVQWALDHMKEAHPNSSESWSKKSFNQKVEALEAVGFKQGKALRFASLAFEDFSKELQEAIDSVTQEDAEDEQEFIRQTQEDEKEAGLIDQVDYNNIGESRTARSKYECEFCNCGFKSNESLTIHYNDLHAVPPAQIDGYENWKEVADDLYKKELAKLKKRGGEAVANEVPYSGGRIGNATYHCPVCAKSIPFLLEKNIINHLGLHGYSDDQINSILDLDNEHSFKMRNMLNGYFYDNSIESIWARKKYSLGGVFNEFLNLEWWDLPYEIKDSFKEILTSTANEWGTWAEEPERMTPDEEANYLRNLGIDDKTLKQIGHQGYHRKNHIPRGESKIAIRDWGDGFTYEIEQVGDKYNVITNGEIVFSSHDFDEAERAYNSIGTLGGASYESYATEDDYKYDFKDLTSLAQDKIESSGVSQSEWDNTPEEEREELEKEIRDGEAYNPSDLVCPECGDITKDDKEFDDHLSAHRFDESYSKESFDFHSDAGHGWLEVPKSLLKELGISKQISSLSYQKGNKVYIEEDSDYMTFKKAYEEKYGSLPVNELPQKDDDSPIRDYQPYGGY